MKNLGLISLFAVGGMILFGSCGNSRSTDEVVRIIAERDSLRQKNEVQQRRMENLNNILGVINTSIDSITQGENIIRININSEGKLNRADALQNIKNLAQLIDNQKLRIAQLEEQINNSEYMDGLDSNVQQIILNYKAQIAQKEQEISNLRQLLEQKNIDIAQLQSRLGAQANRIEELGRLNAIQNEALSRQDAMLNQCYMRVGDKKTLEQLGIVKKGKIVASGALDRSKFSKVDIRSFTELEFDAKRPRILTSMPENSYILTTNGKNHYSLQITNPSEFWSISNYLVIQTN